MKPIKAIAIVDKKSPKIRVEEIYKTSMTDEVYLDKDEVMCEVEIKFIKYKK